MRNTRRKLKKIYSYYLILLIILSLSTITYVYFTLKDYQKNDTDKYLVKVLNNLSDNDITNNFSFNDNYETKDVSIKNIRNYFKEKKYTYKKIDNLSYDIYNNNDKIINVTLKSLKSKKKLGMLKYDVLALDKISKYDNNGLYYYNVSIPSNYSININNGNIKENVSQETSIKGLEEMSKYVNMPTINVYNINNLTSKPNLVIKNNNGNNVDINLDNNVIDLSRDFPTYDNQSDAKLNVDVKSFMENWSLFLSKDLSGTSYGFSTISKYFITNSKMYKQAYSWAHGIDITFTSKHTLKDPVFTNEKISNYVIYNDDAFTCEVYLEKNMVVNGNDKIDYFNSRLDYVKINGEWKVVNIEGV
jgi:hypothetical protein